MKKSLNTPLTPAVLHILMALAHQERHGYDIMKQVKTDTQNRVSMGPGTLYGSLARMLESGLIEERAPKSGFAQESERRIYYGLTGLGQSMLTAELERYREVVAVAESQQILSPGAYCEA